MTAPACYACLLAVLWFLNFSSPALAQYTDAVKIRELTQSLLKAQSPQERSDLLASNKELVTSVLRRWLISEGTTRLAEAKYTEASNAFNIAKFVAEQLQDHAGVATASLNIGTVLYLQGNYDAALESYQQAREIFARTRDQLELARALLGIGFVYKEQGKLDEALNYLKQSQREFEALNSPVHTDELADVLNAIGSVYHSQGNYSEAIKVFESGLAHRDDPQSILRIAGAFYTQGNYLQAIEYYEKVLQRLDLEPEKHGPGVAIAVFGNGLLHVWETMQLNSNAQVVLMPFASPARKQPDTGIGVTAMTWSWFLAGTPTTIISQWSADPGPTIELVDKFRELRASRQAAQPSHAASLTDRYPIIPQNQLRISPSVLLVWTASARQREIG